jgi:hypothetical protein
MARPQRSGGFPAVNTTRSSLRMRRTSWGRISKAGGLTQNLSRRNAKEITLDYERGGLYRSALAFAENRGLHIVQVARTLLRDRLDWTLRQGSKLADLTARLRAAGTRLGLLQPLKTQTIKEIRPMVSGVKLFPVPLSDAVDRKLADDPAVKKQWEEVSTRFRYVFADPETAFRALNFDAVLVDKQVATQMLDKLATEPESVGPLKGRTGILASKSDREARRVAEVNVSALKRDIETYLRIREVTVQRIEGEEKTMRQRVSIDIPALSPAAQSVLERVRDNDLPPAMAYALSNHETKAEIDGFGKAVTERFGERTLLTNTAQNPQGQLFDKLSEGLAPQEKERLKEAWPVMRTAQQLSAHERTVATLKQVEDLKLAPRQTPVIKQ